MAIRTRTLKGRAGREEEENCLAGSAALCSTCFGSHPDSTETLIVDLVDSFVRYVIILFLGGIFKPRTALVTLQNTQMHDEWIEII